MNIQTSIELENVPVVTSHWVEITGLSHHTLSPTYTNMATCNVHSVHEYGHAAYLVLDNLVKARVARDGSHATLGSY